MSFSIRPYQRDIIDRVIARFNTGTRSVVMQMPTGSGKTRCFAELLKFYVRIPGRRALFLAHLDSLLDDTIDRLRSDGIRAGLVQADRAADIDAPVQVASMQTLHARGLRPEAGLIIVDECHRAPSASVRGILADYPDALILGGTATIQRGDGKPLGDIFQAIEMGPTVKELTAMGHLVPCDTLAPAAAHEGVLAMDPVAAYCMYTPSTRAIVFASNKAHARALVDGFNAAGHPAALVLGDTPREKRRDARAKLRTGELRILVSCNVFVEGFDEPSIETIVLARAFTVTGPYLQAIGRGIRPSPATGKTKCTVIDLRGAALIHGLYDEERRWSLTGKACIRTEVITSLRRCADCLAVYRVQRVCPRCGAAHAAVERVPRHLRRAEKLERLNDVPQSQRDASYVHRLIMVARQRMRMDEARAQHWALRSFEKRFGRKPVAA